MKAYKVYAISDGTVIDHIPNAKALKVIDILGLENEGILALVGDDFVQDCPACRHGPLARHLVLRPTTS